MGEEWIDSFYEPKDGRPDDWKGGLQVDGDRLGEYLADSPVLASIQKEGELLLQARKIVNELESSGKVSKEDIDEALADQLNEVLSRYARAPAMRFFDGLRVLLVLLDL